VVTNTKLDHRSLYLPHYICLYKTYVYCNRTLIIQINYFFSHFSLLHLKYCSCFHSFIIYYHSLLNYYYKGMFLDSCSFNSILFSSLIWHHDCSIMKLKNYNYHLPICTWNLLILFCCVIGIGMYTLFYRD
jgi:hypothetical protein